MSVLGFNPILYRGLLIFLFLRWFILMLKQRGGSDIFYRLILTKCNLVRTSKTSLVLYDQAVFLFFSTLSPPPSEALPRSGHAYLSASVVFCLAVSFFCHVVISHSIALFRHTKRFSHCLLSFLVTWAKTVSARGPWPKGQNVGKTASRKVAKIGR